MMTKIWIQGSLLKKNLKIVKTGWQDTRWNDCVKTQWKTTTKAATDDPQKNEDDKDAKIKHLSESLITLQQKYSTKCN